MNTEIDYIKISDAIKTRLEDTVIDKLKSKIKGKIISSVIDQKVDQAVYVGTVELRIDMSRNDYLVLIKSVLQDCADDITIKSKCGANK